MVVAVMMVHALIIIRPFKEYIWDTIDIMWMKQQVYNVTYYSILVLILPAGK